MTKPRVRRQTARLAAVHEDRIQQAISRFKARQTAAIDEASRLRALVSRTVAHLPKRSLRALWNQLIDIGGTRWASCLVTLSEAMGLIRTRLGTIPDLPDVARMRALAEKQKCRRGTRGTTNTTGRRPHAGA